MEEVATDVSVEEEDCIETGADVDVVAGAGVANGLVETMGGAMLGV